MKAHPTCSCRRFIGYWSRSIAKLLAAGAHAPAAACSTPSPLFRRRVSPPALPPFFWSLVIGLSQLIVFSGFSWTNQAHADTHSNSLPQYRDDATTALHKLLCTHPLQTPSVKDFWEHGWFEQPLTLIWLQASADRPFQPRTLARAAARKAWQQGHKGYAYGRCDTGNAWLLSLPQAAPTLTQDSGNNLVRLKLQPSYTYCRGLRLDLAIADSRRTIKVWAQDESASNWGRPWLNVNTRFLPTGLLSLSCLPQANRWGPRILLMIPIGSLAKLKLPQALQPDGRQSLGGWVNHLRQLVGRNPLHLNQGFLKRMSQQTIRHHRGIRHDRRELRRIHQTLSRHQFTFLGENRVKAASFRDMAWLLWFSPRHRSLLLDAEATHMGWQVSKQGTEYHAVMLLARQNSENLSNPPDITPQGPTVSRAQPGRTP